MTYVPSSRLPWQRPELRSASYFSLSVKVPSGPLFRAGNLLPPRGRRKGECRRGCRAARLPKFRQGKRPSGLGRTWREYSFPSERAQPAGQPRHPAAPSKLFGFLVRRLIRCLFALKEVPGGKVRLLLVRADSLVGSDK